MGCERYKKKLLLQNYTAVNSSLREEIHGGGASDSDEECEGLKMKHTILMLSCLKKLSLHVGGRLGNQFEYTWI